MPDENTISKPITRRYYPALSSIVSIDDFPEIIGFIKDGINNLLDAIHYKDLQYSKSPKGDAAFYGLSIVSSKRIDIEIPGTGIYLILNPDLISGDNHISSFPITIEYEWKILSYLREFSTDNFSFAPQDIFEVALRVLNITEEEAIAHFINTFTEAQAGVCPLEQFKLDIEQFQQDLGNTTFVLPAVTDDTTLSDLVKSIYEQEAQYSSLACFATYILKDDLSETWDAVKLFFIGLFPDDIEAYVKEILIPKFKATLLLSAAIEFPRKMLKPVYPIGHDNELEVIPEDANDEFSDNVLISFGEALFFVDTEQGLGYNMELLLNTTTPAQIGNTGLIFNIENLKIDINKTKNIAEADLDGRSPEFMGIYTEKTVIYLPKKWFKEAENQTLAIIGRNLLIGTGGISGKISIEAIGPNPVDEISFTLGNEKSGESTREGFIIGFSRFEMEWCQGSLIQSEVQGSLTIPKFKKWVKTNGNWGPVQGELKIGIEAIFEQDGDFEITATPANGLSLGVEDVFIVTIKSLSVGKDDDQTYIEIAGSILFDNNDVLKTVISEPIDITKLRIYSDGSFEIEGGKIPLPKNMSLKLGPLEITISAIHLGSFEKEHDDGQSLQLRRYKYLGFDGGISLDPGGVDASGKGVKYNFTVDNDIGAAHRYLSIESLAIDLQIPGDVTPDKATLIASGFLALKAPEYTGKISFSLPKVKVAGGAGMKYNKTYPAFLIDAFLELSAGIPLANTGLFIFGFRGLFGKNYQPTKQENENWVDWYKQEPEGINIVKFSTPEDADSPKTISIGAGVSLATQSDALSLQIFLLLSLRNLIMLEGKANIMGERLGLTGGNPPFYALMVLDLEESIRLAIGVNYLMPGPLETDAGEILKVNGTIDSVFYFKDSNAWHVYIGSKDSPILSVILDLFDAYSYLMITKSGIEAGAGVAFGFSKTYVKVVKASVNVYFDIYGRISFESPQIGGSIAVGGAVNVELFGIGLYIALDALLSVEVPEPFRIYGMVELCVGVKLLVKRVEKCFKVEFTWERRDSPALLPIYGLPISPTTEAPVKGIHMLNGETYDIQYFGYREINDPPSVNDIDTAIDNAIIAINTINAEEDKDLPLPGPIPLDTYIDIQFSKYYRPDIGLTNIGGYTNPTTAHIEVIPPVKGDRQQRHEYSIKNVKIDYYNGSEFEAYHPYTAIYTDPLEAADRANMKVGYWQKADNGYNKIRLLAQSPFSYTQNGQPSWHVPAQMGLSGSTIFCPGISRERHCVDWSKSNHSELLQNTMYGIDGVSIRAKNEKAEISNNNALCLKHGGDVEIFFPHPVYELEIQLKHEIDLPITIRYYKEVWEEINFNGESMGPHKVYELVESRTVGSNDVNNPIEYLINTTLVGGEMLNDGISKVIIETEDCRKYLTTIDEALGKLNLEYLEESNEGNRSKLMNKIIDLQEKRKALAFMCCEANDTPLSMEQLHVDSKNLRGQLSELERYLDKHCTSTDNPSQQAICAQKQKELTDIQAQMDGIQDQMVELELEGHKSKSCSTCIETLCYTTIEDYLYNSSIPPQAAIAEDYQLMQDAIEKTISPIWQPDTYYRISVELADDSRDHLGNTRTDNDIFYFGFKTAKSLGYYPEASINESENMETSEDPNYPNGVLGGEESTDKESHENLLKYYLDYDKSYPKPDGDLKYAKPLYYGDEHPTIDGVEAKPQLLLFYIKDYVHHFFGKWATGDEYELVVEILDPTEVTKAYSDSLNGGIHTLNVARASAIASILIEPASSFGDLQVSHPEAAMYNSLLLDENECNHSFTPIEPQTRYLNIQIDDLKPLKLYTALIKNKHKHLTENKEKLVHKYNFQTSRYVNFREHIDSYILRKDEAGNILKKAHFRIEKNLDAIAVNAMWDRISNADGNSNDELYPNNYDKVVKGILDIKSFDAPVTTEVNLIVSNSNIIGIWLRSPEPFNDPRMPIVDLKSTVNLSAAAVGAVLTNYDSLYSRDATEVIVMKDDGAIINETELHLTLKYKLWNGRIYDMMDTRTIQVI